jgi:tripartite-type tricarboxylate transporter receptor subunit TctC
MWMICTARGLKIAAHAAANRPAGRDIGRQGRSAASAAMVRRIRSLIALAVAMLAVAFDAGGHLACAQVPASRPIRIIVPFDPGGAVDVVARVVGRGLATQLDRTVIVENHPGGSTLLAAQQVARSEPDGDTLFFSLDDTFTIVPHLTRKLSFDPNKELVPLNLVGKILMILVANKALPASSLPEIIELAKAKPTELSYASSGPGSATHLSMEMLKHLAQINILHVPFRGLAPALTATASGHVQMTMIGYGTARGMFEEGKLIKPIVITSPERVAALPSVPTTGELGFPEIDATSWLAIAAPATVSAETLARLSDAVTRALDSEEIRRQIEARDILVTNIGPRPFAEAIVRRSRMNAEAVRISGAQHD